jgi:hypothetical protein
MMTWKKKRRDQRKELDEKRREQDLPEQGPVFQDSGNEPGKIEAPAASGHPRALCNEDQLA